MKLPGAGDQGFDIEKAIRELRKGARARSPPYRSWRSGICTRISAWLPSRTRQSSVRIKSNPFGTTVRNRIIEGHVLLGQYAEAIAAAKRFNQYVLTNRLTNALLGQKDYEGARRALDAATPAEKADPFFFSARALVAVVTAAPGTPDDDVRRAIELSEGTRSFHHTAYNVACIRALRGETAAAVEWLRKTADMGMPNYPLFARDPLLDGIPRGPAFVAFMAEPESRWKRLSLGSSRSVPAQNSFTSTVSPASTTRSAPAFRCSRRRATCW